MKMQSPLQTDGAGTIQSPFMYKVHKTIGNARDFLKKSRSIRPLSAASS